MTDDAIPPPPRAEDVLLPPPRTGWLRRLYDWIIGHSKGKYAWETLGVVSFLESSVFPIPPDVILIPMVIADRKRWLLLTLWCTVTSVAGGWLGYALGALLYNFVGKWIIDLYGYADDMAQFHDFYAEYGIWIIVLKGFTPIPYKLVTITAGFAGYDFWMFTLLSLVTRFARFAVVAGLLYWRGEAVRHFIEKHLGLSLMLLLGVIVLGFVLARYLI